MSDERETLGRIRTACEEGDASVETFEEYREEYELLLEATAAIAGDGVETDLAEWVITVSEAGELPTPERVRERARELCIERGIKVPGTSPLAD